jgi:uncharacterized protein (TIGR02246 family)
MADDDRRTDEIAIRELIDHQVMGWAAGSPEGYASVFTSDADYITFLGSHYKGRAAIAASYAPLFKKLLKGSRLDFEITQLRFLTPDVALVHAEGAVVKGRRQRSRRNTRVSTTIAVRTDGQWLLAASQNTTLRRLAEKILRKLAQRMMPLRAAGQQITASHPFHIDAKRFRSDERGRTLIPEADGV